MKDLDELLVSIYVGVCKQFKQEFDVDISRLKEEKREFINQMERTGKQSRRPYREKNIRVALLYEEIIDKTLEEVQEYGKFSYLVDWLTKMSSPNSQTRFDNAWEYQSFRYFIKKIIEEMRLNDRQLEGFKQKILNSEIDCWWMESSFQSDVIKVIGALSIPKAGRGRTKTPDRLRSQRIWLAVNIYMKKVNSSVNKGEAYREVGERFGWTDVDRVYPQVDKSLWSKREGLLQLRFYLGKSELPEWYDKKLWRLLP